MMLGIPFVAQAEQKKPELPKDLPPYGSLKTFQSPQVTIEKLSNGLTIWMVPRSGFPKVALSIAIRGGMAADPKGLPGLSELLLATLDQGTKTRTAKQIAEEFQAAGGDLSGNALADDLSLTTDVLASKLNLALATLADILQNATFLEGEVDLAKRNATDNLLANESEPGFLVRRALAKAMFGDHPYSIVSPTEESITKTKSLDLRNEYAQRFRPDQVLLVVVGDFSPAELMPAAEKIMGSWKAPAEQAIPAVPPPSPDHPHIIDLVERPNSVQTTFALATFGPTQRDSDFAAVQVAIAIYGGMFGSRLVNNIREDKGYTYSPGAFLQTRSQVGMFQTRADVRNAVTGASLNEIDYELNRMATTAPTEDEIANAQRYLVGVKAISLQSQQSVARQLATLWVYGLPPEELGAESEKVKQVTAGNVESVSRKYFPASRQTVVAVGEEKVVREQLAPFGLEVKLVK
jgi:predicted Zn-dependent peptidase